jgi:hypothetical protein
MLSGNLCLAVFLMVALTFAGCHHDKKQADLSGETQAGEICGRPAPAWQGS